MSQAQRDALIQRVQDFFHSHAESQRSLGRGVPPDVEAWVSTSIPELLKFLEANGARFYTLEKDDLVVTPDPVRSRDIPDRLEKFRLSHKPLFKADDATGEDAGETTGPEYAKRMKAEAPGAFVRHDAIDIRPEELRMKHVEKLLSNGETIKVSLLQVLTDDIREKCCLPATAEVDRIIKSYLMNHARSRADYQKQLEKSKPYREVKAWKECHKRPDRMEAQVRLEMIEEALRRGNRKMKKQVHKFPVQELEELASWLRRVIQEQAGGVVADSTLAMLSPQVVARPPSPSSEEKRKRKSLA